ncbi:MAG: hypothetical protein U1F72_04880 [Gammaproteobacteria bacterium]
MAAPSMLSLTSQYWKLLAGLAGLLVGSIAPLFAASGMSWTVGTVIACIGYAFTLLAVRCPSCGSRWFWQASLDASLYRPIFRGTACPACQHDFATPR